MSGESSSRALQNLFSRLGPLNRAETVIVGMGNVLKGDDGAGTKVCSILKDKITARVIDAGTTPENYIGKIVNLSPAKLIIIDAIDFGATPGTMKLFSENDLQQFILSTHCLSPHLFVQTVTSEIKTEVFFIGIQPENLQLGQEMSKQVTHAVAALAAGIQSMLEGSI